MLLSPGTRTAPAILIGGIVLGGGSRNQVAWKMARILVVEDSPDNMKLCTAVLTINGHQVTGLPSGERLLETIRDTSPELVLMDIQLPDKDGFTLLREIRASPHPRLRVIALTAHAMAGDREKALEAG